MGFFESLLCVSSVAILLTVSSVFVSSVFASSVLVSSVSFVSSVFVSSVFVSSPLSNFELSLSASGAACFLDSYNSEQNVITKMKSR